MLEAPEDDDRFGSLKDAIWRLIAHADIRHFVPEIWSDDFAPLVIDAVEQDSLAVNVNVTAVRPVEHIEITFDAGSTRG